jgi:phosphoribosyl-ATP pyrophosphohydrolase/phosphoribosyl-AMP cyclohydrolase/histidinol dehydrogenase
MKFDLKALYKIIGKRIRSESESSYSYKLFKNPKLLNKKILEEANELIRTKNKKQVTWESADLLYFVITFLVKRGVSLEDIELMLERRNKK